MKLKTINTKKYRQIGEEIGQVRDVFEDEIVTMLLVRIDSAVVGGPNFDQTVLARNQPLSDRELTCE